MKSKLLSALLMMQISTIVGAQTDFDTTGLTLIDENVTDGCGVRYNIYEDSEGRPVFQDFSYEPVVLGIPLSELTITDLSNTVTHFESDGTPLSDTAPGREDAAQQLIAYAEAQLETFHGTQGLALHEYANWYRARIAENNVDKLSNDILKSLVKTAIKTTLQYAVPGSKEVVSLIGTLAANTYNPLIDTAFNASPGDPEPALANLEVQFKTNSVAAQISLNTLVTTDSNVARRAIWDDTVVQHIIDKICYEVDEEIRPIIGAQGTVGPTVSNNLKELGLPTNLDEAAQARLRQQTIRTLIRETLRNESHQHLIEGNRVYSGASGPFPSFICAELRTSVNQCLDQRAQTHTNNIIRSRNDVVDESNSCADIVLDSRIQCD